MEIEEAFNEKIFGGQKSIDLMQDLLDDFGFKEVFSLDYFDEPEFYALMESFIELIEERTERRSK